MNVVEFFIDEQSAPQREIMHHLHELLLSYPEVTAKMRYNIPFYYRKSWICYLNPRKDGTVEFAFTRGNELSNEQGLLSSNGRKQVYGVLFQHVKDIPEETVHEVMQEALLLDAKVPYASKRKK